jgi:hypothetical protein
MSDFNRKCACGKRAVSSTIDEGWCGQCIERNRAAMASQPIRGVERAASLGGVPRRGIIATESYATHLRELREMMDRHPMCQYCKRDVSEHMVKIEAVGKRIVCASCNRNEPWNAGSSSSRSAEQVKRDRLAKLRSGQRIFV